MAKPQQQEDALRRAVSDLERNLAPTDTDQLLAEGGRLPIAAAVAHARAAIRRAS